MFGINFQLSLFKQWTRQFTGSQEKLSNEYFANQRFSRAENQIRESKSLNTKLKSGAVSGWGAQSSEHGEIVGSVLGSKQGGGGTNSVFGADRLA